MAYTRRGLMAAGASSALSACASSVATGPAPAPAPTSDVLGDLDAVGVAARIRGGQISAAEAVEAAIARVERVNPTLNFIATPAYDYGRTRARAALSGPFSGVPTLIKDLNDLAGVRTMYGCRAFRDHVPTSDDPFAAAVLASGAVPIGKSTTPEFGLTCTTEPLVTGQTKNPWNTDYNSGGSSGGAGAAVASGALPIAHASDGGGSVRIPASICGLVGLKTSRGRMKEQADNSPVPIGIDSCVSRSVRDSAAWLAAMQRRGADQVYAPVDVVMGPSARRLRIGVAIRDYKGADPDPAVRAAVEDVGRLCQSLGHHVSDTTLALNGEAFEDAFILYWASGALRTRDEIAAAHPGQRIEDLLEPLTLQLSEFAASRGRPAVGQAIAILQASEAQYAAMFTQFDVVLTPTLSKPPQRLGELAPTLPFDVGFRRVREYVRYTPLVNASGGTAISLPLSMSADNLPIGSQFMAAKGDESTLLQLAYELEAARPWAARKPPIWAG